MIPKEFEFRESLPKTMIGKVNYRELEEEEKNSKK
jgi:acyl-coenzyme A synthetase/AMP-(fatty) acid ligase